MVEQPPGSRKQVVTWAEVEECADAIAGRIGKSSLSPPLVFGIARGGLVPAVLLSHRIGGMPVVPIVINRAGSACAAMMDYLLKEVDEMCLLVDDIADSGRTLNIASNFLTGRGIRHVMAAMFKREKLQYPLPENFQYAKVIPESKERVWLLFPWEVEGKPQPKKQSNHNDESPCTCHASHGDPCYCHTSRSHGE